MINWKFLPNRSVSFELHPGFSKKHKGEWVVRCEKGALNNLAIRNCGKPQFFKTKNEAIEYIKTQFENDKWIE